MLYKFLASACFILSGMVAYAQSPPPTPEWVKELIIYEVATKGYTSPKGPESGNFNTTREKIPYMKELGINGIWLTGTNLGHPNHFYNVWTQYANIRPDELDPSLGTPEEFKALIDEAHRNDIRVFMDVITHGVMSDSPLVSEHPGWFRGGSWGMADFDWSGERKDLEQWWVETYTNYVIQYGIDGFRLDVKIYRPDLWNRIKQNAADAGHPITVFNETWDNSLGTCDFMQRLVTLSDQEKGPDSSVLLHTDVAGFYEQFLERNDMYRIATTRVEYMDGSIERGNIDTGEGPLKLVLLSAAQGPIAEKEEDREKVRVRIEGINPDKAIKRIVVMPFGWYNRYYYGQQASPVVGLIGSSSIEMELTPFVPDRLIHSIQLSSHDDGWDGFPLDQNPYVAQGSRAMFGYSLLFAPAIPIFMSGEEFNADYIPIPTHTTDLYGKGEPGKGRWLYASMIDWNQLQEPDKQQMLNDVKRMIAIRKADKEIFTPVMTDQAPPIRAIPLVVSSGKKDVNGGSDHGQGSVTVPYLLYNAEKGVVICGNPTPNHVRGTLTLSLEGTPLAGHSHYYITDLWSGGRSKKMSAAELLKLPVSMKPDYTPEGGLAVLKIEPVK